MPLDSTIHNLPAASLPLDGTEDMVVVQFGVTKRCSTQDAGNLGHPIIPYKEYTVLMSNSGGTITVIQLKNTIGDGSNNGSTDIAWTVPSNGVLEGDMSSNPFTSNKTYIPGTTLIAGSVGYFVSVILLSSGTIQLGIRKYDNTASSTPNFSLLPIKLLVYP